MQELPNPVHYLTALIFASPLDTPSPATYLRDALHGFSMNTLLVRDFEGLAQNLILTPLLWFRNRQRADNGRYVGFGGNVVRTPLSETVTEVRGI